MSGMCVFCPSSIGIDCPVAATAKRRSGFDWEQFQVLEELNDADDLPLLVVDS